MKRGNMGAQRSRAARFSLAKSYFTAASHAQKAADYLHGLQPQTGTAEAEERQTEEAFA